MRQYVIWLVWGSIFSYLLAILFTAGYFAFQVWGW